MNDKKELSIKSNIFMMAIAVVIALIIPSQIDGGKIADSLGARFVPYLGCGIVFVPNAFQLVYRLIRGAKWKNAGSAPAAGDKPSVKAVVADFWGGYGKLVLVLAMAFVAAFSVEKLGYILTYCLLCGGMLLTFREKRWYFYLISFILVVLVYIGFTKFLYVPLPTLL